MGVAAFRLSMLLINQETTARVIHLTALSTLLF